MDVTKERIYCAEQIKVPAELPNIMKDYTKELLKNNPVEGMQEGDASKRLIYEWSLKYDYVATMFNMFVPMLLQCLCLF
ncbi:unnamed protein product [Amoebophrya sp. A25]|nr:unnamed protein product [Amoebophrya sp. A25]|eukprot:GSA25T00020951001.1